MTDNTAPHRDQRGEPTVDPDDLTGFMVYDLTEKRFVGHKADSKTDAEKTVEKRDGHKYETRKV